MGENIVEAGTHQYKTMESHGFDGACRRADIAGMAGFDKDKTQRVKNGCVGFWQVHLQYKVYEKTKRHIPVMSCFFCRFVRFR